MKVLDYQDLCEMGIRYTRVHLARLMAEGKFPRAIQLSLSRVVWDEEKVLEWLEAKRTAAPLQKHVYGRYRPQPKRRRALPPLVE